MANYPQGLAQDAGCQSHTGHMSGLWFLPVITDVNISGLYLLGTKEGLLEQLYARSEFIVGLLH